MTFKESVLSLFDNLGNGFNRTNFNLTSEKYQLAIKWKVGDLIAVVVLALTYHFTGNILPFERLFAVNDLRISLPFTEQETVTANQLFIYGYWFPFAAVLIISLIISSPSNKMYTTYISLLGLTLSLLITANITQVLKNFIGNLRPDFLARCIPKADTPINTLVAAKDVCTTDNASRLLDGFRSTPSGHSSYAFSGLFYLTLWLLGQFVCCHPELGVWRSVLAALPTLVAAFVAISRLEDYRHHYFDVMSGSLLGALVATYCYYKLFPSLLDKFSYNPRLVVEEDNEDQHGFIPVNQQV